MKLINDGSSNGVAKGIVTKSLAEKAIATALLNCTARQRRMLVLPTQVGHTTHLCNGVDLTKIVNPDNGPIKFRFVFVGFKSAIESAALAMA